VAIVVEIRVEKGGEVFTMAKNDKGVHEVLDQVIDFLRSRRELTEESIVVFLKNLNLSKKDIKVCLETLGNKKEVNICIRIESRLVFFGLIDWPKKTTWYSWHG